MSTSETIQRWDAFMAKILQRTDETLGQAEQGCAMLLDLNDLDPMPFSNAWTAIENQLRELGDQLGTTFDRKVEPALEEAGAPGRVVTAEREKGEAARLSIERKKEEVGVRIFGVAARKIFAAAKENLAKRFPCTQCGGRLPISDQFFRSVHVACPYCKTVNTFVPGTQVQAVEYFCCHHLAREKTQPLWLAWVEAERRMNASGEDLEAMKAAERALLAYTEAYLEARIEIVPEYRKDLERDRKGKMAFFYEQLSRNPVWKASARERAREDLR